MTDAEIEAAVEAGKASWGAGDPMRPMPPDSTLPLSSEALHWLGYVWARWQDFQRRREMALYPDRVEFRP